MPRPKTEGVSLSFAFLSLAGALASAGCSAAPDAPGDPLEEAGQSAEALETAASPHAVGFDLVKAQNLIHGIAGDDRFVFVTEPLTGRVTVHSRVTGRQIAELPPPPGGFLLPFTLRVPERGRLVVLDPGGFPNPAAGVIARVYDYDYDFDARTRSFRATLARTVRFDGLPVGFSEDVEVLDDGSYVLTDSVIGAIWLIEPDGAIRPGLLPSSFEFGQGLPFLEPCILGTVTVDGIPLDLGGGYAPGAGSVAASGGYVYWGGFCHGGIHRISLSTLRDSSRSAEERAQEIEVVTESAPGSPQLFKGLTFNRFDPNDRRLYATDCFHGGLVRIDVETGQSQTLISDSVLFDFPVSAHFLPPLGLQTLMIASDQEHRFDALNAAIDHDMFRPPFRAAEVLLFD